MKLGKEIKVDISDKYNLSVGTLDNKNSKSLYLILSTWCEPIHDDDDINYNRVINNMNKAIKKILFDYNNHDMFVREQTIVDLDLRESGIRFNKRSFLSCEITLFQKNHFLDITSDILLENIKNILNKIITDVLNNNEYLRFNKTKK